MPLAARWMRLGPLAAGEFRGVLCGLAGAQASHAPPILVWTRASADFLHGLVRAAQGEYVFALLAPLRLAPGRVQRWPAWGLAPAIATYRHFGLRAYLNDEEVWLNGRCVASSAAIALAGCAVIVSTFLPDLAAVSPAGARPGVPPEFRSWLREGLSLSSSEWTDPRQGPAERELEAVFRSRVQAQHGWQFETAWPSGRERAAIARARGGAEELAAEALSR
jgi:hypothetical protein